MRAPGDQFDMTTMTSNFAPAIQPTRALLLLLCTGTVLFTILSPHVAEAQAPRVRQVIPVEAGVAADDSTDPQALVLSVKGKCEYSEDGATFLVLKPGHILKQAVVIRTGKDGQADLFFRRIGTSVRLQSDTDIKLEKMERHMKDGAPVMDTLLNLRTGRIFTVVRSLVPGSTFEIRNAAGRSVVEGGGGKGRYIITADGTHVTEKNSALPLKVIAETGITVIAPGMKFDSKEGKMYSQDPREAVKLLIDFDELDATSEKVDAAAEAAKKK